MLTFLTGLQKFWLGGLWLVWALLLFGGFVRGGGENQRMPRWTRLASSLTLTLAGWSWWLVGRGTTAVATPLFLLAFGMTLGFLGDLFMAGLVTGKRSVLGGMGSFGLGHVAYVIGILRLGTLFHLQNPVAVAATAVLWWLIGLGGWYLIVYRGHQPGPLHYAALPYALLLASTAGFASGLAVQNSAFIPLALGAILFLASDLTIAGELFNHWQFPFINDFIWLTYGPGQMLIVYTAASVLRLLK